MLITIQAQELKDGLGKILSIVDKKNSRLILTYALLTTKNNTLELSATDLEVSAKVCIPASVDNPGNFCINVKNLFEILKELPNEEIQLTKYDDENTLRLTCGDIFFSLVIQSPDDFPQLAFESSTGNFSLNPTQILEIINKTSYAILNDETRLHLNGIFIQEVEGKLRAVATDGHRLALYETELSNHGIETLVNGIIIPKKGVNELKKVAENYNESSISLSVDESFMYISVNNKYYLSIRLITREYPKYQAVIPNKTSFQLIADKNALLGAIKRIKIMSNEKSNGVRIKFNSNEMQLIANHPSLGDAEEKIPVSYSGKEMEIGFNAKYLIDALSSFEDNEVVLELNNELSPAIIKAKTLPNYLGIIMPLKL